MELQWAIKKMSELTDYIDKKACLLRQSINQPAQQAIVYLIKTA